MFSWTDFFLYFANFYIIVPLVIFGYFWQKEIFYHAVILIFTSIVINVALKISFQVPLAEHLGKHWFAFPSGHMQIGIVIYGWLALQFQSSWFRILVLCILSGLASSLVYAGFHDWYHVLGGIVSGSIILLFYKKNHESISFIKKLGILICCLTLYNTIRQYLESFPIRGLNGFFGFMGFTIGHYFIHKYLKLGKPKKSSVILYSILTSTGLGAIGLSHVYLALYDVHWLLIGLILPVCDLLHYTFTSIKKSLPK